MFKFQRCVDIRNSEKYGWIDLIYYNDAKSRRIKSFYVDWYFVIARKDYEKYKDKINKIGHNKISKIELFEKWIKIYCLTYKKDVISIIKSYGITTYEADIQNTKRFWLDKDYLNWHVAKSDIYKIAYFDIETDDSEKGLEIGASTILSWSIKDSIGKQFFLSLKNCRDEKELLKQFLQTIKNYDIITGWNSNNYDIPYIKARLALHKLSTYISVPHIDMMHRMIHSYRFDTKIRSYSLDYISNHFLKEQKIKRKMKVIDMFNDNFELFKKYNIRDTELLYLLDKKCHIFDTLLKQLYWCNIFPREIGPKAKGLYAMLDSIILRKSHKHNIYGPSPVLTYSEWSNIYSSHDKMYKTLRNGMKEKGLSMNDLFISTERKVHYVGKTLQRKLPHASLEILSKYPYLKKIAAQYQENESLYFYEGGYVITPKTGLYPLIYSFDYKSLYPSIIRSFNIGFETLTKDILINKQVITNPAGTYFKKNPQSILSIVLEELMEKRKLYKQRLLKIIEEGKTGTVEYEAVHSDEVVVKELSNSSYGITGNRTGRYFSKGALIPRSITLAGQALIKLAAQFAKLQKYDVCYGDTDSIMIVAQNSIDIKQYLKKYHKWLAIQLFTLYNITNSIIKLEFDRMYKPFILLSKKAYTGRVLNQEHKQVDYIYSRGIDIVKSSACHLVVKLQTELINLLLTQQYDIDFFKKWIVDKKQNIFKKIKLPDDLIIHSKLNKNFNEYKNKPVAVVIAENKLKREGILLRKEIEYIITGRTNIEHIDQKTGKVKKSSRLTGIEPQFFNGKYDKEYYWNNIILPSIARFLNVIFKNINWKQNYKYDKNINSNIRTKKLFV